MTIASIVPSIRGSLLFSGGGVVLEPPDSPSSLVRVAAGIDSIDSPINYLSGLPRIILDYLDNEFLRHSQWPKSGEWRTMPTLKKLNTIFSVWLSELKRAQKEQRKDRTQFASFFALCRFDLPTSLGMNLKNKGDLRAYFEKKSAISPDEHVYFCSFRPDQIIPIAKLLKPYTDTP